jgi:hypothetical protein
LEGLRFLTERGANQHHPEKKTQGKRNRPVLRWTDGSCITMMDAVNDLGFLSISLWSCRFLLDATKIENALQEYYHNLMNLGNRLWRRVAKGQKRSYVDNKPRIYQVFLTFSYELTAFANVEVVV